MGGDADVFRGVGGIGNAEGQIVAADDDDRGRVIEIAEIFSQGSLTDRRIRLIQDQLFIDGGDLRDNSGIADTVK